MKSFYLLVFIFVQVISGSAQNVQYILNNGFATDIIKYSDGGFVLTGGIETAFNDKTFLMKFDSSGNVAWLNSFSDQIEFVSHGTDLLELQNNGFIMLGYIYNDTSSTEEISLMKCDLSGNLIWSKRYGNTQSDLEANKVVKTKNGYLISGFVSNAVAGQSFYLLNVDTSGNIISAKSTGSLQNNNGVKMISYQNGFVFGGDTQESNPDNNDICLIYYDSLLNITRKELLSAPGNQLLYDLSEDIDGGLLIAATTDTAHLNPHILVVKLLSDGNVAGTKIIEGDDAIPNSIHYSNSGCTITGNTYSQLYHDNSFIIRLDSNLQILSEDYFGDTSGCAINSFFLSDDTVFAAGYFTFPANNNSEIYFNKYLFGNYSCFHFSKISSLNYLSVTVDSLNWQTTASNTDVYNSLVVYQPISIKDSLLCSFVISTHEISPEKKFTIYPNPASGNTTIILDEKYPDTVIKLYSVNGELIRTINSYQKINTIETEDLTNGIYFVNVLNRNSSESSMLIVNHDKQKD